MFIISIIISILILSLTGVGVFAYIQYKNIHDLNNQIADLSIKSVYILGKVDAFDADDEKFIAQNKDFINRLMKYYLHRIMLKTDSMRTLKEDQLKSMQGYLNCLHDCYNDMNKLLHKKVEKEEDNDEDSRTY